MADSNFDAKNLALRAQKKVLGSMANKTVAKMFIDDTTGSVLDNLYKITKEYLGSKKDAEKIIKYIIKTVIKTGVLYRNDEFSSEELVRADGFRRKFHSVAMTVVSFYEVDFSFDKHFLSKSLNECGAMIKSLVQSHLTDKSIHKIDKVFQFYSDPLFLETVFKSNSIHRAHLGKMCTDLHKLLDENAL